MKALKIWAVLLISIALCSACCSCTEKLCIENDSGPYTIILDESIDLSEIDSLKIQEYDAEFNYIGELLNTTSNTEREFSLQPSTLDGTDDAIAQSIIILRISSISQVDTISNLSFAKKEESLKCNDCSGMGNCEDDFYTHITYSDVSHEINGEAVNQGEIRVRRK